MDNNNKNTGKFCEHQDDPQNDSSVPLWKSKTSYISACWFATIQHTMRIFIKKQVIFITLTAVIRFSKSIECSLKFKIFLISYHNFQLPKTQYMQGTLVEEPGTIVTLPRTYTSNT